jgi:hypothetical protein
MPRGDPGRKILGDSQSERIGDADPTNLLVGGDSVLLLGLHGAETVEKDDNCVKTFLTENS